MTTRCSEREEPKPRERLSLPEFEVDPHTGRLDWRGNITRLEPMTMQVLIYLMSKRHRWVSAKELGQQAIDPCWSDDGLQCPESHEVAANCVAVIRRSLGVTDETLISSRYDPLVLQRYRFNESAI